MNRWLIFILFILHAGASDGQLRSVTIAVRDSLDQPVKAASLRLIGTNYAQLSDDKGLCRFPALPPGNYLCVVSCTGFTTDSMLIKTSHFPDTNITIHLRRTTTLLANVLVTGSARSRLIREIPGPVVSIAPIAVRQATESNIIDVLVKNTPGLQAVKTGANISKPVIRGLGYNRVLVLYDGLRQEGQQWGDEHGVEADAYGIEKAVVIKGPASLVYGSDALAGVVSLVPESPKAAVAGFSGRYTTEYQSNNRLWGSALSAGWNGKQWKLLANGSARFAGNYRNAVDGRVYNTGFVEKNAGFTLIRKQPLHSPELRCTLYDNLQGIPDGSRDSLSRQFTRQIAEGDSDDIKNRPPVPEGVLNGYRLSPLHQHIQHYRIYFQDGFKAGKMNIDLLAGWQQNIRREYNHPTQPQLPGMHVRLNSLHYGIQTSLPLDSFHTFQWGISGMQQKNSSASATDFPIPDYHLHEEGIYAGWQWQKAGWSISGGIRYDQRQIRWDDFYTRVNPLTHFGEQAALPDTTGAVRSFPAFTKKFTGWSGSLGIVAPLSRSLTLKASIGRGYRSPNITEMASNGLDPGAHIIYLGNRDFHPEFSLQEDLGLIWKTETISAELNLFNNYVSNYIYLSMLSGADGLPLTDAQGNRTFQYKQSAAQLYGMEAWMAWQPARLGGLKWESSLAIVYGYNRIAAFKNKGNDGEYLPLMPAPSLRTNLSKTVSAGAQDRWKLVTKIETESAFRQDRYLSLNNTETATEGYTLVNTGFTASLTRNPGKTLEFVFMINNLFDVDYQSHLSRLKYLEYYQQSPDGKSGIYNMGRNVCVKLNVTF